MGLHKTFRVTPVGQRNLNGFKKGVGLFNKLQHKLYFFLSSVKPQYDFKHFSLQLN